MQELTDILHDLGIVQCATGHCTIKSSSTGVETVLQTAVQPLR